jgi:site-specific DNA-methyltransferase (adenine-specific)
LSPTSTLLTKTVKEKVCRGYTDCGCNAGFDSGIVLDPFMGSGTTALVALQQNKRFVGIELNPAYIEIALKRIKHLMEQSKLMEIAA